MVTCTYKWVTGGSTLVFVIVVVFVHGSIFRPRIASKYVLARVAPEIVSRQIRQASDVGSIGPAQACGG
jgi:hypothetical protein